ncbi:hypothetical protein HYH03_017344 [Edaphochlamys debaryana]|uniref:2'-phosphotransferase n=1 Tax=Edaphochlamys debaryana TaxID=47281 RepID=A0A836BP05_9CHLO|nr:hypothetical protein HYH03_017344 [Edaphochlamys debaryana]|eukprot:KAG2483821.1 hypothetical protein HYH03_017344 [Edaphochlamys debaryana]
MSKLLRHNPPPGTMDAAGWISLPVLLRHLRQHPTEEQVRQVVDSCPKKRFVLDDSTQPPRIRAAQGHSVELADAVLDPVTDAAAVPVAVHVTSNSSWEAIQASGHLLRMKRTHVHFATAPHHMRTNKWADVLLRLDLQAGLAQGLQFFRSSNDVLLCEGPVPVGVVSRVELTDLPPEWQQAAAGRGQGRGQGQGQQAQGQQGQGQGEQGQGGQGGQGQQGKGKRQRRGKKGGRDAAAAGGQEGEDVAEGPAGTGADGAEASAAAEPKAGPAPEAGVAPVSKVAPAGAEPKAEAGPEAGAAVAPAEANEAARQG